VPICCRPGRRCRHVPFPLTGDTRTGSTATSSHDADRAILAKVGRWLRERSVEAPVAAVARGRCAPDRLLGRHTELAVVKGV
jgi:hypothetical protein